MPTIEEGLRSQVRNIEATYGRSMAEWAEIVRASRLNRHGEIVTMLKRDYGMTHGAANRTALVVLDGLAAMSTPSADEVVDGLYSGKRASLRPLHELLMAEVRSLGPDVEVAPKRGYLSLRRRTQFAMIQPAATRIDLGLVLKGHPTTERLESAATFNALFTHRVRVSRPENIDGELIAWLHRAYDSAG